MTNFSFKEYEHIFTEALHQEYQIITLKEYFSNEYDQSKKVLVNRIDVDFKIERLNKIYEIFKANKIKASIYLRLHSPVYNLLSIGNIILIKKLIEIGCEISLHTELEDLKGFCHLESKTILKKEIAFFESIFNIKLYGTASHGDMTPYNNLDFWKQYKATDFGLLYEAYDEALWNHCRYVSDSEWTQWKAYENGVLLQNDRRTPIEHMDDNVPVLHLLTHPESWYEEYIYE